MLASGAFAKQNYLVDQICESEQCVDLRAAADGMVKPIASQTSSREIMPDVPLFLDQDHSLSQKSLSDVCSKFQVRLLGCRGTVSGPSAHV